jgi:MoaD family protein
MKMEKIDITFYGGIAQITKEKNIKINGSVLKEIFDTLVMKYGEQFKKRIYDEKGKIRRFINIYVNGRDIRFLNQLNTKLEEGDKISIVPAVGGG